MKKIIDLYKKYEEIINYLIVGGLTTVLNYIVYIFCTMTFLNPKIGLELQIANIISWIIAVIFAYFTNRKYVFKSKNKNKIKEASKFVGVRIISLFMDMFIMFIMVSLANINDKIAKLISQIFVIIANYIFSKLLVFKK